MQSRKQSLCEVSFNYISGFFVAWAAWEWGAVPLFGLTSSYTDGFLITCYFTVISFTRSYIWRRAFNRWQHGTR